MGRKLCYNNTVMVTIEELLEKLNKEQRGPVMQTEGPVLVLAGAGSGKTRVLTTRIAYLVEEKAVPPEAILAITFTNKAANEMKERLSQYIDVSRMWVCTIHSMCVRIIRMYADEVGVQSNFSIYSETERNNIIKKSFQECDYDGEQLLKTVKYHIANAKMLGLEPDEYAEEYASEREIDEIVKVYKRYQKHLKENNSLDFDDLLNETRNLLKKSEDARNYLGGRFRYILVDEFQDTNGVQYEIIRSLASVHGNLFAVGDDDQSIYGWRGAQIENILHFEKDFKNAKVFKLERNYRSTKHILKLANTVIRNNANRKDKTLWTENGEGEHAKVYEAEQEDGEARYVAQCIAGLLRQGYKYSDFAILMRINALTRSFEQEFTGDGIPYKVFGGFKFFERKEIKDLLAYLRIVNNPFDSEAALRIINFPKRGIGAKTVETLQNYAYENELSIYDALLDVEELGFTSGTREKLEGFRDLITKWITDSLDMPVNDLVKTIVEDTQMREVYADDSDESINKRANVEEFINSVEEYCKLNPGASLTDYLNQVTLASDTDEMDDGNYVTLATIHAVKGLEFRCVFLCGMEENTMPISRAVDNDEDMEEERRLMYVAITRAKERIYFTRSKSRYLYGKREPTMRSRFLKEMASEVELPKETRPMARGYSDWDDPESYGNSAYGGGRYGSNDDYGGRRTSFGGGYGATYGGSNYGSRGSSSGTRTPWNGGTSYGGSNGSKPTPTKQTAARVFGGAGKPAPTAPTKDLSVFTLGKKVRHPKFGEGTIIGLRGTGSNMILDIAFEGLGIKQLSATLAPLTVI
ncbi:MAG: UvrD-helicase domain-containing protein [Clostridia bacterium]|nr:UvrD-helicase domain-containing protein [Clostridia bacterium]